MGLFDRISRVVRANVNDLVSKAEDPEKILEQTLADMQGDLIQLRQAVAGAIATQKRLEQQYNVNQGEAGKWQQRAQLALTKGDENLAREALQRKKTYQTTADSLKQQLDSQKAQVDDLKRNLTGLESKISEAKTKKDMLKARAQAAKANEQLQRTIGNINTNSSMAAFDRMEDKVLQLEARSQAAQELGGFGIEQQFAALEAGSVDAELEEMKRIMLEGSKPAALTQGDTVKDSQKASSRDPLEDEIEKLRRQMNKS